MPIVSKAQARLMFATANGANTGVPKDVASEFIRATPKYAFPKLAERLRAEKAPAKKSKPRRMK